MIEVFFVQYCDMSEWEPLAVVYCSFDELQLNISLGLIVYAEDTYGEEFYFD